MLFKPNTILRNHREKIMRVGSCFYRKKWVCWSKWKRSTTISLHYHDVSTKSFSWEL